MTGPVFSPFGENATLITLPADIHPARVLTLLAEQHPTVPARAGLTSILVHGSNRPTVRQLEELLAAATEDVTRSTSTISIPVHYTGEDLTSVADAVGLSVDAVIAAHQATVWQVALIGFAPGFPYLTPVDSDDAALFARIPRLDSPRAKVPAGAVAVAAGMSCIYPSAMPGGWQILGTTTTVLFDAHADQPSLLTVGQHVQFTQVRA